MDGKSDLMSSVCGNCQEKYEIHGSMSVITETLKVFQGTLYFKTLSDERFFCTKILMFAVGHLASRQ